MPISDLDGRYRPQRLGKVRLGRTEERKIKGKIINIPYATEFFVMDDMPEQIREEYGEEPTTLRIEFLFNSIEQVFPHYHKYYLRRGLRCMGDGEIVLYRAAGTVEEPLVCIKNAVIWATDIADDLLEEWTREYGTTDRSGNSLRCLGFECPSSKPGKCRPKGRLCFAIQGHEALGYYEMGTGSINAIAGIVGQFQLALSIFGHIDAIPWNLHLRPETVQVNGKGMKIYVPWIEIDPSWLQRHFRSRGDHLRAIEESRRSDIADLYGREDVEELDHEQTPQALLEVAREEDQQELAPTTSQAAIEEAQGVVEGELAEMQPEVGPGALPAPILTPFDEHYEQGVEEARAALKEAMPPQARHVVGEPTEAVLPPEGEPPSGPETVTKRGNIYERLLEDANHNLKKRGYEARYTGVEEIRQAMDEGGVKGRLTLDKYMDYLTIVLHAKEN